MSFRYYQIFFLTCTFNNFFEIKIGKHSAYCSILNNLTVLIQIVVCLGNNNRRVFWRGRVVADIKKI